MATTAVDSNEEDLLILDDDTSDLTLDATNEVEAEVSTSDTTSDTLVDFTLDDKEEAVIPEVTPIVDSNTSTEEVVDAGNDLNLDFSLTPDEPVVQKEVILEPVAVKEDTTIDFGGALDEMSDLKSDIKTKDIEVESAQNDNFDLETAIWGFIDQISTIKEKNLKQNELLEKEIESLEWDIKISRDKITDLRWSIKSLKDDNDKIDSKIWLLNGNKAASFHKTRKKAV
jgi:hypothetical protein